MPAFNFGGAAARSIAVDITLGHGYAQTIDMKALKQGLLFRKSD